MFLLVLYAPLGALITLFRLVFVTVLLVTASVLPEASSLKR